jgi:putative ABC transport system ATP-binding protein
MDSITVPRPVGVPEIIAPERGRARPCVLVETRGLSRVWGSGHGASRALDGVDLELDEGEFVAIVGPSGSGKSTLGALLAGIDKPTGGSLVIGGVRLDRMRENALAKWRSRHLGIVLQDFSLLPTLTAAENVELGLKLAGFRKDRRRRARQALEQVGLDGLARRLPVQLSGGEQQRVAIARAVARRPQILVADEPTGSLDSANGELVFRLIRDLAAGGTTVVFITHDPRLAAATPRVVTLVDGRIDSDRRPVAAVTR